jgi:hypothetical protein
MYCMSSSLQYIFSTVLGYREVHCLVWCRASDVPGCVHCAAAGRQTFPTCQVEFAPKNIERQNCFNPILHTAWLDYHAVTLKSNNANYCFGEQSSIPFKIFIVKHGKFTFNALSVLKTKTLCIANLT